MINPWAIGPWEILQHGISLLKEDTDANRRLAMISIDNSVELMMQTFIQLPQRITLVNIARKERDEICLNFPSLLDGIDKHASAKIEGVNLGEIEWFHRLRNQLYHQGNGLTVELAKVEVYAELARRLFACLFDEDAGVVPTKNMQTIGGFLEQWRKLEVALRGNNEAHKKLSLRILAQRKKVNGDISDVEFRDFLQLSEIRNKLVHGELDPNGLVAVEGHILLQEAISAIVERVKF